MENIFLVYELDDCQHMVLKGVFFDFARAAILAINSTTGKLWDDYFVQETPPERLWWLLSGSIAWERISAIRLSIRMGM